MNQNILTDVQFRDEAKKIIIDCWNEANVTKLFGVNWELMKYQIRTLAIRRGKEIAKLRREKEEKIVHEIIRLSGDCNINQENKNNLLQLQFELDRIYEFKARGVFIRSRKKWLEEGEKSTKYLFNMEKRNVECTSMVKLNINGKLTENVKEISR